MQANDSATATFVVSKQWFLSSIGFGGTCPDTQVINQIPGMGLFHNKKHMWRQIQAFEASGVEPAFRSDLVIPPTYLISEVDQCKEWLKARDAEPQSLWVLKDATKDNQEGVWLMNGSKVEDYRHSLENTGECTNNNEYLMQRLIHPPLLIQGHKFDMRVYVLLASTDPVIAFVHPMLLVRRSHLPYDLSDIYTRMGKDLSKDGRNQMTPLNLTQWLGESEEWLSDLYSKVKFTISQIMSIIVDTIPRQPGQFTMLGIDIMVGDDGRLWLLEVNQSPELTTMNRMPWRLAFQQEMMQEVVDIQLALMEARRQAPACETEADATCSASSDTHPATLTRTVVAAARHFEPVWLESSGEDGAVWAYHLQDGGRSNESGYASRLSYLDEFHRL